jgi:hypothetical protein
MARRVARSEALDAVAALAARHPGRAVWVGIDGLGAAGKSTLAAAMAAVDSRVVVVNTDDLQGPGVAEWDWPRLQRDVVTPLLAGRAGRYRVWQWGDEHGRDWRDVPAGSVVVLEGVSATRRELAVPWDLTIWVDVPAAVRRQRAVRRDGAEAQQLWEQHWWPSEQRYVARERPVERVDLIVSGDEDGGGPAS